MISSGALQAEVNPHDGGGEAIGSVCPSPNFAGTLAIDTQSEPGSYARLIRDGAILATEHVATHSTQIGAVSR